MASRAVAEWKEVRDRQEALAVEVSDLSGRAGRWQVRRKVEIPPGLHDPADPARPRPAGGRARVVAEVDAMLAGGNPHRPHIDAMPN